MGISFEDEPRYHGDFGPSGRALAGPIAGAAARGVATPRTRCGGARSGVARARRHVSAATAPPHSRSGSLDVKNDRHPVGR